jgi:hypothetical protein
VRKAGILYTDMAEGAPAHGSVAHLLPQTYKRLVAEWLEEDTPSFDYGGFVVGEEVSEAKLLGKSEVRKLVRSSGPSNEDTGHSGGRPVL